MLVLLGLAAGIVIGLLVEPFLPVFLQPYLPISSPTASITSGLWRIVSSSCPTGSTRGSGRVES